MNPAFRSRRSAAEWTIVAVCTYLALALVAQRHRIGFDLWPDVVCQTYVGWRIARGDMLFTDIWESHPPAAVLLAAVPHWFAEPSYGLTLAYLGALAAAMLGAAFAFLRSLAKAGVAVTLALSGLVAAYYYRFHIGARSEDVMMIFSAAALALSVLSLRSAWWRACLVGAGLLLGFSLLAKPGAIAAALVCGILVLRVHPQRLAAFALLVAAALIPLSLVAAWLASGDALQAAYLNVVEYGRAYFRPFDRSVVIDYLRNLDNWHLPWLICGWLLLLTVGRSPLLHCIQAAFPGLPARRHAEFFVIIFILWPLLEFIVVLPQTTMFAYLFYPLVTCLLLLLVAGALALVTSPQRDGSPTAPGRQPHDRPDGGGVLDWLLPGTVFALLLLMLVTAGIELQRHDLAPTLQFIATVVVALSVSLALAAQLRAPGVDAVRPVHALTAYAILMVGALGSVVQPSPKMVLPGKINQSTQTRSILDTVAKLRLLQQQLGGDVLWFDVAPALAYFARLPNVTPEYLSHPLFLPNFATDDAWTRIARVLETRPISIVLVWTEWYDVMSPERHGVGHLAEYRRTRQILADHYREVARFEVYPNMKPVTAFVRREHADRARSVLQGDRASPS